MVSKFWKISLIIASGFGLLVLESIIKYSIVNKIPSQGFYLFKPIVQIIYTPNYNIAFSLPLPQAIILFFIISALVFLSYLWWHNLKAGNIKLFWASSLVIAGALSNLIDRFALGFVVDYINIHIWPIFNLADCLIVAGVLVYIVSEFKVTKRISKGG
ncbi:MAG: signal peptidase II [Candidatus Parcubacteria bacterium]|nr:signal peptidase II [Candidatus Parcubacteria bacterium]